MERKTEIIRIESIDKLPPIDYIESIPRSKKLKIIFDDSINHLRTEIGLSLIENLPGFQVSINNSKPEIWISKLITKEEVNTHQKFFENCAKDYRDLGRKLILELAQKKKIILDEDFPFLAFNRMKGSRKFRKGKIQDWNYFFHGFHCHFINTKTKQEIEVPFMFGMEFGDLDPYFFSIFINTNPDYQPLPINIYENFADGERILKFMLELGLFEKINSNLSHHSGTVVKDRDKIEVKVFDHEEYNINYNVKTKFNILKFLRIKRF